MSIRKESGVTFDRPKNRKSAFVLALIIAAEAVFSFFLYLSLAQHILAPTPAESAAGVPQLMSYQGRLTDSSGNPLGGTGTVYCFRYSIYDAASAGNKLWPAGTPTNTTTTVVDGVFADNVGRMDTLNYDFVSTSTLYLNVAVNQTTSTCGGTWEDLVPRQQITASGFALTSQMIYGNGIRIATTTKVQIGTGAGTPSSQTMLSLDVKNAADSLGAACTDNGSLWYNSINTRALVCENGTIQPISNSSTTLSGFGVDGTVVVAGNVVLSNSNNVTFGINGSTITASAPAGGGQTLAFWPTTPLPLASSTNNTGTTAAGTNITASFHISPLVIEDAVSFSRVNLWVSNVTIAGTGTGSINRYVGIYTLNGGTALSLLSSFLFRQEVTQNSVTAQSHRFYWGTNSTSNSSSAGGNISSNYAGVRAIPIFTGNTSLSAGKYYLAYGQIVVSAGSNILASYNNMYVSVSQTTAGQLGSAVSLAPFPLIGQFSSTTTAGDLTSPFMPNSINTTVITNTGGTSQWKSNFLQLIGTQI